LKSGSFAAADRQRGKPIGQQKLHFDGVDALGAGAQSEQLGRRRADAFDHIGSTVGTRAQDIVENAAHLFEIMG
jgi:hypothetical protein